MGNAPVKLDPMQLRRIEDVLAEIAKAIRENTEAIKEATISSNTINVFTEPDGSS